MSRVAARQAKLDTASSRGRARVRCASNACSSRFATRDRIPRRCSTADRDCAARRICWSRGLTRSSGYGKCARRCGRRRTASSSRFAKLAWLGSDSACPSSTGRERRHWPSSFAAHRRSRRSFPRQAVNRSPSTVHRRPCPHSPPSTSPPASISRKSTTPSTRRRRRSRSATTSRARRRRSTSSAPRG